MAGMGELILGQLLRRFSAFPCQTRVRALFFDAVEALGEVVSRLVTPLAGGDSRPPPLRNFDRMPTLTSPTELPWRDDPERGQAADNNAVGGSGITTGLNTRSTRP